MEIGDIVTKKQILNEWLQLQEAEPREEGRLKYTRGNIEFIFTDLGNGRYQLYEMHTIRPELSFYT